MSLRTQLAAPLPVPRTRLDRRQLVRETVVVLLLSLGASAIYSVLSLIRKLASTQSLDEQTSTLNPSQADQSWLDLIYQLVGITLALVPVALALMLLGREIPQVRRYLGLDGSHRAPDLALGGLLAAVIGIPGLVLYLAARAAGLNTQVVASGLGDHWWSLPVLVLSAAQNAALEEIIMLGYLFTRWGQTGWPTWRIVLTSAVIRGSYHLYQGFGGFVGNLIMGLLLGCVYVRTRRVLPMVIAHTTIDVVAFVGYAGLHGHVSWL